MGTVFLVSRLGAGVAYPVQRPLPLSQVRCGCSFPAWGWGMAGQQGVACPPAPGSAQVTQFLSLWFSHLEHGSSC